MKKLMKRLIGLIGLTIIVLTISGCWTTAPDRGFFIDPDNAARLIEREDFKDAARCAPEWVRDALKIINDLEYHLEIRE